jgi:uncharacterized protein YcfJ
VIDMTRYTLVTIVFIFTGALVGCQNPGTVGGAVVGGVIGSQFGSGKGKTAATIGGALLGGYVGNRAIDQQRRQRYYSRYQRGYG